MKSTDRVKEILKGYKPSQIRKYKCKDCGGYWSSKYGYVKCPVCGGKV